MNRRIAPAFLALVFYFGNAIAATSLPVNFKEGKTTYQGDLYLPKDAKGKLPLVVVVHEWWGKNEYPKMRAQKIADELGYAALAVDLYGQAKTVETPKEAGELAGPFYQNPMMGVARIRGFITEAIAKAKTSSAAEIDPSRLAVIGYCFGGAQALNFARAGSLPGGARLLATVAFHANLSSSLKGDEKISSKVLVLHGEADSFVKEDEVKAFKAEMKARQAELKFVGYPGAVHAFTNPKATAIGEKYHIPIAYNEKADSGSWKEMVAFLKSSFGT